MFAHTANRAWLLTALAIGLLFVGGCAGLRCPRIDPSGERLFICPRDQVQPVAASTNPIAPPAYTDPVFPQPPLPGQGPAVGGLVPPLPQDRLNITPGRVLAPVGSEVILRAGLCTRENYLLTDSKIEWLLARDEVGEFVELGGRGWCKDPWLPWNKPKKIDNQYAIGYTAKVPLQITRGTANTTDDVAIQPGEAWASVTSPVEGVSRITAVAPEIAEWSNRRATATIYWVDVQWTFPATTVTAGGGQVLTTTVLRQTDGTPLEGWLVRYEVADGSGSLRGNESGQVVEVPTDASGRASIDVTPTGSSGSTTRINTQLVRPAGFGNSNAPRLEIASGSTIINWTEGGDYVPPPDDLGDVVPPSTFPGAGSSPPIQAPTPAPQRLGPRLEAQIYDTETDPIQVGQEARFEVVIRNVGDTTATGIIVRDEFAPGLTHLNDTLRQNVIETDPGKVADIAPGDSRSIFLTFGVQQSGRLCQNLTVRYNGGQPATAEKCINVSQAQPQAQGRLQVTKQGARLSNVNDTTTFTLAIRNVGDAALTNIEVVDSYDPELQPQPASDAELQNGSLFWRIPRLEAGDTWRRDIECRCAAAKLSACGVVTVSAETGNLTPAVSTTERACIEIRPQLQDVVPQVAPPTDGNVTPNVVPPLGRGPAANNASGLLMEILSFANPVRAGTPMSFQIVIRNSSPTIEEQVQLRVLFPQELTPDVAAIRNDANVRAQFDQVKRELLFEPIATLRNNERIGFVIPCIVLQPGVRNITAQLVSKDTTQVIQETKEIQIIGR